MFLKVFFLRSEPITAFGSRKVSKQVQQKDPNKLQENSEEVSGRVWGKLRFVFGECTANDVRYSVIPSEHRNVDFSCQVENHDVKK